MIKNLNKWKNYFLFFLKVIFTFSFEIKKPTNKKFLIIDALKNPLSFRLSKNTYNVLYRRGEKLNLPIIFECLLENKLNSINYYCKYIKYSNPKFIVTFYDHIHIFYLLSELTKRKTIMFQFGTKSYDMGILSQKSFNHPDNYKKFYIDYIFVQNKKMINFYKKFVRGKIISIGSFQNNFKYNHKRKIKQILFLSTYRPRNVRQDPTWHQHDDVVIKDIYRLAKKNNIKFNILGRSTDSEKNEIKYYSNILNTDKFSFIPKNKNKDSYKIMQSYKYIFTTFSTLAKENLANGGRSGIFLYKPRNNQGHILRLGYGQIEGLKNKGPFWVNTKKYNYKELKKVFDFVVFSSDHEWKKIRKRYVKPVMDYDHNNKKFFNIVK